MTSCHLNYTFYHFAFAAHRSIWDIPASDDETKSLDLISNPKYGRPMEAFLEYARGVNIGDTILLEYCAYIQGMTF